MGHTRGAPRAPHSGAGRGAPQNFPEIPASTTDGTRSTDLRESDSVRTPSIDLDFQYRYLRGADRTRFNSEGKQMCKQRVLASAGPFQIHACDECGGISVHLGPMTFRLDSGALRTLHQVTSDAVRRLSDESSDAPDLLVDEPLVIHSIN